MAQEDNQESQEQFITLNPYIIENLGIIRNRCRIQTDDYKLSCVPYQLSLQHCKVLLILSQKEQKIITEASGNLMLHLEFNHPDYSKPVPLFIRITLIDFRDLNKSRNQCLLTGTYQNLPNDYRTILVDFFRKRNLYKTIYSSIHYYSQGFDHRKLAGEGVKKNIRIRTDEGKIYEGRIISLGVKKLSLYMDIEQKVLQKLPESFLVEMKRDQTPFMLNGSIIDFCGSKEVEGFHIVQISLQFSDCLIGSLYNLFTTAPPDEEGSGSGETSQEGLPGDRTEAEAVSPSGSQEEPENRDKSDKS